MTKIKLLVDKEVWAAAKWAAGHEKASGSRKPYWLEVVETVIHIVHDISAHNVPFI